MNNELKKQISDKIFNLYAISKPTVIVLFEFSSRINF